MTVALSGTGTTTASTSILSVSPSSIAFGTISVGSEVTKTVQLASTGTGSVTISGMTFSGSGISVTGLALPTTLAAGKDTNLTDYLQAEFRRNTSGDRFNHQQRL